MTSAVLQLNISSDLKSISLGDPDSSSSEYPVSPESVYAFVYEHKPNATSTSPVTKSLTLPYYWPRGCVANLVCRVLGGAPCGEYILEMNDGHGLGHK